MKQKKQQYARAERVTVAWSCVVCSQQNQTEGAEIEQEGGCFGHGPEEYCYCGPVSYRINTACEKCGASAQVVLSE